MNTRERVYEHIIWYKTRNDGNSPTMQELCIACGLYIACGIKYELTIFFHLNKLEEEGKIRRKGRQIFVTDGRWSIDKNNLGIDYEVQNAR